MTLLPADMGGGAVENADGSYTVTDSSGQSFQMTPQAFEDFISNLGLTIDDLGIYRDQVLGGSVIRVREDMMMPMVINPAMFQQVDTVNLKLGGFDDAKELQEVYKTTFYPSRAEQLDRVYHGLDTGRVVSQDIMTTYVDTDDNVTADVATVQSEFNSRGGGISESDVSEAREENEGNSPTGSGNQGPGSGS